MSVLDIKKSIESFLEKNNLLETLNVFRNENSYLNFNDKGKNLISSDKPLVCVSKKQAYQLQKLSNQSVDFHNPEV
jgi:hypothetical protein